MAPNGVPGIFGYYWIAKDWETRGDSLLARNVVVIIAAKLAFEAALGACLDLAGWRAEAIDRVWDIPAFRMRYAKRPLLSETDVQHLPDLHRRKTEGGPKAGSPLMLVASDKPDGTSATRFGSFEVSTGQAMTLGSGPIDSRGMI